MPPQRPITPSFDQTQLFHPGKGRAEVFHNVLRMARIYRCVNSCKQKSSRFHSAPKLLDDFYWVDQVLEHVHSQNHIEARLWQGRIFQIHKARGEPPSVKAPPREIKQRSGNVRQCRIDIGEAE